jgi:hypothetical protein
MRKKIYIWLLAALTLMPTVPVHADPADMSLTPGQVESIKQHCVDAQGQLQRIQRNDAVTRTNRGRNYDAIIKLMTALNNRVTTNSINAPKLSETSASLQRKFQQFYDDFTNYDTSLTATIRKSCQTEPEVFYASLTQTRGLRVQLSNDIRDMDKLALDYLAATVELKNTISGNTQR